MKGVILAGGFGTRLGHLTKVTNKHLLPIYDKPMLYYPLETMLEAGISEVMVVMGEHHAGAVMGLLSDGSEWRDKGLETLYYAVQKGAGGIAEAALLSKSFIGNSNVTIILGDNVFLDESLSCVVKEFDTTTQPSRGHIVLHAVPDPERYGCPRFSSDGKILEIIEKPDNPASEYGVIGVYIYTPDVFDVIPTLNRSDRGELEITDVHCNYLRRGVLTHSFFTGTWLDAGTFESLYEASSVIRSRK